MNYLGAYVRALEIVRAHADEPGDGYEKQAEADLVAVLERLGYDLARCASGVLPADEFRALLTRAQ